MIKQSILNDKLRSFDYYKSKLPMYLQSSYGFVEHFRIWYEMLVKDESQLDENVTEAQSVVKTIDMLFEVLNIFDLHCAEQHASAFERNQHYLELVNRLEPQNPSPSDMLDKIGSIFGLKRQLSVTVNSIAYQLSLTNEEFLMLIRCSIIKNYFDGSYKQLSDYYAGIGLPVFLITVPSSQASCILQLVSITGSESEFSDNVKKMFASGLLTVESAGISYSYSIITATDLAVFDSTDPERCFDGGKFVT